MHNCLGHHEANMDECLLLGTPGDVQQGGMGPTTDTRLNQHGGSRGACGLERASRGPPPLLGKSE